MAMSTTTTTPAPLRMKLLVDTRAQRVVFAEASKEVVDFLFSFLALPLGTVVMLLGTESVVGSVGSLYGSVENLERSSYHALQPGVDMDALLRPVVLPPAAAGSLASLFRRLPDARARPRCPCCARPRPVASRNSLELELSDVTLNSRCPATTAVGGGFVQGGVTYTVTDDLAVAPMSAVSTVNVFNTMAVRDIGAVQQRTVLIGCTEALKILKASFESKTVLTDVFVRNRSPAGAAGLLAR